MKILLTGATGLIGDALLAALLAQGHEVTALSRRPPVLAQNQARWVAADMAQMQAVADWLPLLAGHEVVINTVGIFQETKSQSFAALHTQAPAALFQACTETGVQRVIQLSALGAASDALTAYWRSKARADAVLMAQPLDWTVVRPSLVYADTGTSSQFFLKLAAAPVMLVPANAGSVQPIHLDDLVALLLDLALHGSGGAVINAVGPQPLAWEDYLHTLRQGLGMAPVHVLRIPAALMTGAAKLASYLLPGMLQADSLRMLRQGSVADVQPLLTRLGRPLRMPDQFSHATQKAGAVLSLWLPLLRLSLVFVWLFTALVSACNQTESLRLLADAGVPTALRPAALWAGVGLDALLGVLTLTWPSRRLWQAQMLLILAYSGFITLRVSEWWWHPFGPVSKNLPILALLGLLAALAPAPGKTAR